jgi:hypothetical protein
MGCQSLVGQVDQYFFHDVYSMLGLSTCKTRKSNRSSGLIRNSFTAGTERAKQIITPATLMGCQSLVGQVDQYFFHDVYSMHFRYDVYRGCNRKDCLCCLHSASCNALPIWRGGFLPANCTSTLLCAAEPVVSKHLLASNTAGQVW